MPKDRDETVELRGRGKWRDADTAAEMFSRLLISFPQMGRERNFAHLAYSFRILSIQSPSLPPPSQKLDGVLLPGDYFAFISCRLERTVEIFLRRRERQQYRVCPFILVCFLYQIWIHKHISASGRDRRERTVRPFSAL